MTYDLSNVEHHPAIEEIVDVLCKQTRNTDRGFFQAEVAYFLGKMASAMRVMVKCPIHKLTPVNIYTIALAGSGYGKGTSVNIMENQFMKRFEQSFMDSTFPVIAEKHLWDVANKRAARNSSDQNEEFEKVEREFRAAGHYLFTFDSGSSPAVKQFRHKLLLSKCGSINLQIDEIGSNMATNTELLNLFLELYDHGQAKQKLTKNHADNVRNEDVDGKTPANMLLFGTPVTLFDGHRNEDDFYTYLQTGYGRRCLFGWGMQEKRVLEKRSPKEKFDALTSKTNDATIAKWSDIFHDLANPAMYGWVAELEEPTSLELIAYQTECEELALAMGDHEETRKSEMMNRHYKAMKLAGVFAFIDKSDQVEIYHLKCAIKLVEDSGEAFNRILKRDKSFVKLAKYIAQVDDEVTHADLIEALPYYKAGQGPRNELMSNAMAWGYKNHIIIKKTFVDNIEFFRGETLKETNFDEMILSVSDNFAYNYAAEKAPFDQLHVLAQQDNMHWSNHHFKKMHRASENVIPGFNMIVIDVDGGVSLDTCHELLSDYKFMTYTTKRHTPEENRFRLILPINYVLELDGDEYKEFMNSFMLWLPFETDAAANQRSKKWETFKDSEVFYNTAGEVLDALPFVPKTSKNEAYRKDMRPLESLDNMERWFATNIASGNRNSQMIKYALALADSGMTPAEVGKQVHAFNKKINKPLTADEIDRTIMVTVAKRYVTAEAA